MNEADVIVLINDYIKANGNKEITGIVLNQVLLAMIAQPNNKVGELDDLNTGDKTDIVSAINELFTSIGNLSTPFTVHTGDNDPNVTPPAEYDAPDFYVRVQGGNTTGVYIYNGADWVQLLQVINPPEQHITVSDNLFELRKNPANGDPENVEEFDVALNGWISNTVFVKVMSFTGGDPTDIGSWEILEQIGE